MPKTRELVSGHNAVPIGAIRINQWFQCCLRRARDFGELEIEFLVDFHIFSARPSPLYLMPVGFDDAIRSAGFFNDRPRSSVLAWPTWQAATSAAFIRPRKLNDWVGVDI